MAAVLQTPGMMIKISFGKYVPGAIEAAARKRATTNHVSFVSQAPSSRLRLCARLNSHVHPGPAINTPGSVGLSRA